MLIVIGVICIALGIACAVISLLQFMEKGFLFNNAYIWASKEEREKLDKKPHYRQSAIVFALCAAALLLLGVECILNTRVLMAIVFLLAIIIGVYAIVSSVRTQRQSR